MQTVPGRLPFGEIVGQDGSRAVGGGRVGEQYEIDVVLVFFGRGLLCDHFIEQSAGHGAHAPQDA